MKILLPVDGSDNALEAVRHALRLLQSGLRASFVLANVQEPATLYEVVVAHNAALIEQISEAAAAHSLAPAQALLGAAHAEFETEVGHGDPAQLLLDIAERCECELVILGARGQDVGESGALGSVASAVLQHARMAVMVVRRGAAQGGRP